MSAAHAAADSSEAAAVRLFSKYWHGLSQSIDINLQPFRPDGAGAPLESKGHVDRDFDFRGSVREDGELTAIATVSHSDPCVGSIFRDINVVVVSGVPVPFFF